MELINGEQLGQANMKELELDGIDVGREAMGGCHSASNVTDAACGDGILGGIAAALRSSTAGRFSR